MRVGRRHSRAYRRGRARRLGGQPERPARQIRAGADPTAAFAAARGRSGRRAGRRGHRFGGDRRRLGRRFSQITLAVVTLRAARARARGRAGNLTLETLVREELRPILKGWLDQYLPDMSSGWCRKRSRGWYADVQRR